MSQRKLRGYFGDTVVSYQIIDKGHLIMHGVDSIDDLKTILLKLSNKYNESLKSYIENNVVLLGCTDGSDENYTRLLNLQGVSVKEKTRVVLSSGRYLEMLIKEGSIAVGDTFKRVISDRHKYSNDILSSVHDTSFDTEAWVCGCFACCGTYGNSFVTISFTNDMLDVMYRMKDFFTELGYETVVRHQKRGNLRGDYWDFRVLKPYNVVNAFTSFFSGSLIPDRRIPSKVYSWSRGRILSFLAGIVDMRGSITQRVHGDRVELVGINKVLNWQIADLFRKIGYNVNVYYRDNSKQKGRKTQSGYESTLKDGNSVYFIHTPELSHFCQSSKKQCQKQSPDRSFDRIAKGESKVRRVQSIELKDAEVAYLLDTECGHFTANMVEVQT